MWRQVQIWANNRTPLAVAVVSGCAQRAPGRFKHRREPPQGKALQGPPKWMRDRLQRAAWNQFRRELPWLREPHTSLVEIAVTVRARMLNGEALGAKSL